MDSTSDKRHFHRIPETVAIDVRKIAYPMPEEEALAAVGKNISAGGICFAVPRPYDPGDILSLQISLTGWQRHKRSYAAVIDDAVALAPLTVVGKVAWCREADDSTYEIGALFENVYEDDLRALEKYLAIGAPR